MSRKKTYAAVMLILFAVILNIYTFRAIKPDVKNARAYFNLEFVSDKSMDLQVFYKEDQEFSEEQSVSYVYDTPGIELVISAEIDIDSQYLRLDFGDAANTAKLKNVSLSVSGKTIEIENDRIINPILKNHILELTQKDGDVQIKSQDRDPWIVMSIEDIDLSQEYMEASRMKYLLFHILLCIIEDIVIAVCIFNIETLFRVPLDIYRDKVMFWDLVKNDFQARFAGSYFGIFWAYVQPVITMVLYWFVFQIGLRSGSVSDYPFILFLMSGLIPWFYFSEAWSGASNSLFEYSYLVKKVVFNVGILPVLKVASALFVHIFFLTFLVVMCLVYGYGPDLYLIQLMYYILCTAFLVLGLSYITAACTAFFRDMSQIINIALTIGVWITPIMWNPAVTMTVKIHNIFKINPVYYIVDGFRDSLLAKVWFWEKPIWSIYFWIFSVLIYIFGVKMFNRLKVHFSDVL